MPTSSYVRYEDPNQFKKPLLPLQLARRISVILADHSIDPTDVMALAGVSTDEVPPPPLSAGEEHILSSYRGLTTEQRVLLQMLADQMTALTSAGPEGGGERPTPQADIPAGTAVSARKEAA